MSTRTVQPYDPATHVDPPPRYPNPELRAALAERAQLDAQIRNDQSGAPE
jgi:hypothetical protein